MDTSRDPIIELREVSLTLQGSAGPVNILRGVDLAVGRGESVGIMGASGAGKTSLLMVLSGLERATSGSVRVAGRDVGAMDEDALARFRGATLGIVFQGFHLVPAMTALENVALPLELAGVREAFAKARESLLAVGLSHRLDHFPAQLSGGEQQRVALARAFASAPDLILADEPTGNLDMATGAKVMDLLFNLCAERGATLVLVTHDRSLAGRCGRRMTMRDGLLAENGEAFA
ncbi:ABC transporter related protein [Alkalidesulfovibrio alkalitolerans DSM 16529]|uniref:ABC transporter related protein n=1 Tax=Alkalidesulfovibrio alkalitolerans DSM 16529 TaxID=1121439 RepID=S7URY1_9BACT|nr:ABC transporter ATP-binding protein [Alkalidesulfovibrio alkalitolerans]EPR35078.1 ABC transporter related protein [Alkalidesulfovibrio alkalitolerans DSM 16529]